MGRRDWKFVLDEAGPRVPVSHDREEALEVLLLYVADGQRGAWRQLALEVETPLPVSVRLTRFLYGIELSAPVVLVGFVKQIRTQLQDETAWVNTCVPPLRRPA